MALKEESSTKGNSNYKKSVKDRVKDRAYNKYTDTRSRIKNNIRKNTLGRFDQAKNGVVNKVQQFKNAIKKIKRIAQVIQAAAKPIAITTAVVTLVGSATLWITSVVAAVGTSPHFYCDKKPDKSVKQTKLYQQYCGNGDTDFGEGIAERMSAYCFDTKQDAIDDYHSAGGTDGGDACGRAYGVVCGTELYKEVHDKVLEPGDKYYASCDRSTGSAVRWSGADDNFCYAVCDSGIIPYCQQHTDIWQDVVSEINSQDDLEPGDVCVYSKHICMFIGEDAVAKFHPNIDASATQWGEGSLGTFPPAITDRSSNMTMFTASGHGSYDGHVFRNIKMQDDSKYKDIEIDAKVSF